jgi:hypothetical protein
MFNELHVNFLQKFVDTWDNKPYYHLSQQKICQEAKKDGGNQGYKLGRATTW